MEKHAHYSVSRDKKGGYRFKLVAPNGETVMTSESYGTRRGMMNALKKMGAWATTDRVEEIKPKNLPAGRRGKLATK